MSKKMLKDNIKEFTLNAPEPMEYYINIETSKKRDKYISRIEKIIRSSLEYRDYIQFLKENMDLNKCIFFQSVCTQQGSKRSHISIELHHEPFTLYDYVAVVLDKYDEEGIPLNDLLIADEVLKLHYENKVGLVPLSKTAHQMVHSQNGKIFVPINMCYGEYDNFIEEYEPYISDDLYNKLDRKIQLTKNLTPESFEALKKEFTYINVNQFDDIQKIPKDNENIA